MAQDLVSSWLSQKQSCPRNPTYSCFRTNNTLGTQLFPFQNNNNQSEQLTKSFKVLVLRNCGFHHDSQYRLQRKTQAQQSFITKTSFYGKFQVMINQSLVHVLCVLITMLPRPAITMIFTKSSTFVHFPIIFKLGYFETLLMIQLNVYKKCHYASTLIKARLIN